MKTLDEIIKGMECCEDYDNAECEKCPYASLGIMCCSEKHADALHYLKEHKNQQDFYAQSIKRTTEMIDKCEKTIANYLADMDKNDPLTFEELTQMIDKPVWIYEKCCWDNSWFGSWKIIEEDYDYYRGTLIRTKEKDWYEKNQLGKTWMAFRKERK